MPNKMKLKSLLIFVVGVLLYCLAKYSYDTCVVAVPSLVSINVAVSNFIKESGGRFPESLSDWEQSGLLRKSVLENGSVVYSYKSSFGDEEMSDSWSDIPYFSSFEFAYGQDVSKLKIVDNKVYNLTTNEEVLFIDGPVNTIHKSMYEKYSCKWFNLMKEYRRKGNN